MIGRKYAALGVGVVLWLGTISPTQAGEADVVAAQAVRDGAGIYRFQVTVAHADTGWDHYADKWDVVGPDGSLLGTRVLVHPHENEQPFTRSLGGVAIPAGVDRVTIRAHDSVHEYGGKEMTVEIKR
jgi:hypothetical protein